MSIFGAMLLEALFIGCTLLTALLLLRSISDKQRAAILMVVWLAAQGAIAFSGFYEVTHTLPPRFALALLPPLLLLLALLVSPRGRSWMTALDLRALTILHVVRLPVELGLHALYEEGGIPAIMTWEGRNLDIISGITAPVIVLLAFRNGGLQRTLLIVWNLLCLGLVLNVVVHGILSVPTPLQQFGFEQPNTGLLRFPFVWLPAFIVPVVILAHAAALLQLCRPIRTGVKSPH